MSTPQNFYAEVGGAPVFAKIVARFYEEVARDEVLRPLYPEEDLGPAEVRLRMFLEQYWGGPRTYSNQRGHPRLRMRHAVDTLELAPELDERLWTYLHNAAMMLVNTMEE